MHVVIVGAGPAGLTVAEQLRARDPGVEITLLSAEPGPPYSPPALVDYFLSGREDCLYWKGKDVAHRLGVAHRSGVEVRSLRPAERALGLGGDEVLGYDRLVIASGSRLHAPVPGVEGAGVYNFKSLTAARALVERARRAGLRAIVVGAGFIGLEIALLLRELGAATTILEMRDQVMPLVLDAQTAALVRGALERHGVEVRTGCRVLRFDGEPQVSGVELESGERLGGDVFVAATGVRPNIDFLKGSGLEVGWGVRVDEHLRTSAPGVYACGDVAETRDLLTGELGVHAIFPNAVAQARVVAENLLGGDAVYEGAERMNSLKHLGVPVVAAGDAEGEEELRYRTPEVLRRIFLRDGRIVGFRLAGDVRSAGVYRSLMLRRAAVDGLRRRLARPDFGEGDLIAAARLA